MTPRIYQFFVVIGMASLLCWQWTSKVGAIEASNNCSYFSSAQRAARTQALLEPYAASALTTKVANHLAIPPATKQTSEAGSDTIDRFLFDAMAAAKAVPAQNCTDLEFIRRVTLDLTGRIPTPERIAMFLAETATDKRAKLIDELLAKPEWVDKWTMFFGGLLRNFSNPGFAPARGVDARDAYYKWIQTSLRTAKPYNQWATELLTAIGEDSTAQGELNWLTGTLTFASLRVGVLQETYDQQALYAADNFLGISHMDCILCHNGRGHLDEISLWGRNARRSEAWELASFFSRTDVVQPDNTGGGRGGGGGGGAPQQTGIYAVRENTTRTNRDYFLDGVELGNRPPRNPIGTTTEIKPRYAFSGKSPAEGERYRVALAREITADKLFAISLVNRLWKEFFVTGLVEPVNALDPARLDPDNPPPAPWQLQASNPRLLVTLAQEFVAAKYDVKWLLRQLANSRAYQLSARYDGAWKAEWERLYARKLVRRLGAEEMHDAIAQSSGLLPSYTINKLPTINYAMQFPETVNMPVATVTFGTMGVPSPAPPSVLSYVTVFLDSFLRGDNSTIRRNGEFRVNQALELLNNKFVLDRVKASNSDGILAKSLSLTDEQLINKLFQAVLSRPPSETEKNLALSNLKKGVRTEQAENLLWTLYNKVDFLYNY